MSAMRTHTLQTDSFPELPRLRLVPRAADAQRHSLRATGGGRGRSASSIDRHESRGKPRAANGHTKGPGEGLVLVAGDESGSRAAVMRDLTETMPANTRFDEARDAWEVLALAPKSRMIVLSGDLGDLSAKSAMHMLAHRLPEVPVVSLAACA
ncbi:MAG TPA: hypothetical protein VMB05_18590 [Solirubrobacteraceae bacterium]|nr:hypothetical protein [Solirubrobacteraceae bacterium]